MLREFFYINKSDRRIIIALLAVIVVALAVVHIFGNGDDSKPTAAVQANDDAEEAVPVADTLFAFDPNTADSTTLLRLGLPRRIVTNLLRYRRAGGVFSEKQDFARLYDLTVGQYQRLEPYIQIAPEFRPASTLYPRQARHGNYGHYASGRYTEDGSNADESNAVGNNADSAAVAPRYSNKLQPGETIALCDADTTMLRRIPGIGSYYARRIVEYGERLGGYVSLQQLSEIDDIPPQAADYLTLGEPHPRQLNLNTLSLNELKRHPYINYYQARAIVDYRRQHGAIRSLDQLSLLPDFTADAIERLRPYVTF